MNTIFKILNALKISFFIGKNICTVYLLFFCVVTSTKFAIFLWKFCEFHEKISYAKFATFQGYTSYPANLEVGYPAWPNTKYPAEYLSIFFTHNKLFVTGYLRTSLFDHQISGYLACHVPFPENRYRKNGLSHRKCF